MFLRSWTNRLKDCLSKTLYQCTIADLEDVAPKLMKVLHVHLQSRNARTILHVRKESTRLLTRNAGRSQGRNEYLEPF